MVSSKLKWIVVNTHLVYEIDILMEIKISKCLALICIVHKTIDEY